MQQIKALPLQLTNALTGEAEETFMELTSERIVAEIGAASFHLPSDDSVLVLVQVEIPKNLLKDIDERFGKGRIWSARK